MDPKMTILGYVSNQSRGQLCLSTRQSTDSQNSFRGKRFALKPWDQGVYSSRIQGACCSTSLQERFTCFPLKALWRSSTLSFLSYLSQIISYGQLEFLEEAPNRIYFQGSLFMTGKLFLLSKWVLAPNSSWIYPHFFRFQPPYKGKKLFFEYFILCMVET